MFAVGTQHAAVTGADGRFRLTGLTEGVHRIAYRHPVLDEIGYQPEAVELEAKRGEIVDVRLLTPPRREWLSGLCADKETVDSTGAIAGIVLDDGSGRPVPDVQVFAVWSGQYQATTDQDGRFLFCGVPVGPLVVVGARDASPSEIVLDEAGQGVFVALRVRDLTRANGGELR